MPRPSARRSVREAAVEALLLPARTGPSVAAQPGPPDPLVFQMLNEVGIVAQLSGNLAARLLAPGLNLSQFTVLNHFTRLGGERSLVQLAGAMQVTKGAMSNTIARLLDKGLVSVQPDPNDGRGKLVRLTPAGLAARQQAVHQLAHGLSDLSSLVPDVDLAQALAVLRTLRQWFDTHR